MRHVVWLMVLLSPLNVSPLNAATKMDAVAVLNIQATGIDPDLIPTLTEVLSVEIAELGIVKVIAGRDIEAMLGFEKQKDVVGCTDAACLAEIGGALGVDRVVAGHIGKVGSTFVVNIKLINIRAAETEGRVYETVRGEVDALIDSIRDSVHKLFAKQIAAKAAASGATAKPASKPKAAPTPEPAKVEAAPEPKAAPPRKVASAEPAPSVAVTDKGGGGGIGIGPIVLWGVGAVGVAVGTVFGLEAKSKEKCANKRVGDSFAPGAQACISQAKSAATLASVMWAVGGAAIAGGFGWWLLGGGGDDATALAPIITERDVGLALTGRF